MGGCLAHKITGEFEKERSLHPQSFLIAQDIRIGDNQPVLWDMLSPVIDIPNATAAATVFRSYPTLTISRTQRCLYVLSSCTRGFMWHQGWNNM